MREVYGIFGFTFELHLSTRPEKYLGEIEVWNKCVPLFFFLSRFLFLPFSPHLKHSLSILYLQHVLSTTFSLPSHIQHVLSMCLSFTLTATLLTILCNMFSISLYISHSPRFFILSHSYPSSLPFSALSSGLRLRLPLPWTALATSGRSTRETAPSTAQRLTLRSTTPCAANTRCAQHSTEKLQGV